MNTHVAGSVGGAKGGYIQGALDELYERGWLDRVATYAGNSVSALIASMGATGQLARCSLLWQMIRDQHVYRYKFRAARAGWAILRDQAMLDLAPLLALMQQELVGKAVVTNLITQHVNYNSGLSTHLIKPSDGDIDYVLTAYDVDKVYRSAAIPFVFPTTTGADGGLENPIPLDAVIRVAEPGDRIIIISAHPVQRFSWPDYPRTEIAKLVRSFDIMQARLARASVQGFLTINRMLEHMGVDEWYDEEADRRYVRFEALVIAPPRPLDHSMLDFTGARNLMSAGRKAALEAIG